MSKVAISVGVALFAAKKGCKQMHMEYMKRTNTIIIGAFMPRVYALILRFVFPTLTPDTNFSLSCIILWCQAFHRMRKSESYQILAASSFKCTVTSFAIRIFLGQIVASVLGPIVSLGFGILLCRQQIIQLK